MPFALPFPVPILLLSCALAAAAQDTSSPSNSQPYPTAHPHPHPRPHAANGATGATGATGPRSARTTDTPHAVVIRPRPGDTVAVPGTATVVVKNGAAVAFPAGQAPASTPKPLVSRPSTPRIVQDEDSLSHPSAPRPHAATGITGATVPLTSHPHLATGETGNTTVVVPLAPHPHPASGSTGSTGATGATGSTLAKPAPSAATTAPPIPSGPPTGPINRTTVVLDPSHGGSDSGGRIADNLQEKDVTLRFANRLRSLLEARGFTVVLTRDADPLQPGQSAPSLDTRAGIANHARAAACLLLHATGRGSGVHLYRTELPPAPGEATLLPWSTAQSAWVQSSQQLTHELSEAFSHSKIPLVSASASIRPLDSLTCPAVVLELAPDDPDDPSSIVDDDYQARVAQAVAASMIFWSKAMLPPVKLPAPIVAKKKSPTADEDDDTSTPAERQP